MSFQVCLVMWQSTLKVIAFQCFHLAIDKAAAGFQLWRLIKRNRKMRVLRFSPYQWCGQLERQLSLLMNPNVDSMERNVLFPLLVSNCT